MGFSTFSVVTKPSVDGTGVAVSLKKVKITGKAILGFTFRPAVVAGFGWTADAKIEVALGEDEHHGLVRLRPSEAGTAILKHRQAGGVGKRGGPYFSLSLGHVPLFVDRSEPKRWVTFEQLEDGWVEIVLPRWADETGPKGLERKRQLLGGQAALPPPAKPSSTAITSSLMGDPPPNRSALAQRPPTRGEARRAAERREAPEIEIAEHREREREAAAVDRLAQLITTFALTMTEAKYLLCLMDGRAKTKEMLLAAGKDGGEEVDIKIVDVFVHKLRKKLKTRLIEIETVWGQGYRMTAENIARVMVLLDGGAPGREDDEADLAAMPDDAEAA